MNNPGWWISAAEQYYAAGGRSTDAAVYCKESVRARNAHGSALLSTTRIDVPNQACSLIFSAIILCIILVSLSLSVCLRYCLRSSYAQLDHWDRATLFLSPIWLGCTLTVLVNNVLTVPLIPWNSVRLVPTLALADGYDVYTPLDQGLIISSLYPPIAYLLYLPVMLASTPTGAFVVAGVINGLLLSVPAGLVFWAEYRHDRRGLLLGTLGCCVFVWLAFHSYTLGVEAYNIHADIGAVAFGALACVPYLGLRGGPTGGKAFVSSLFVALAVWTKQPMIAVGVGIPIYVVIAFGTQAAIAYIMRMVLVVGGMSLIMCAAFGTHDLLFNIFTYPGMHPRNPQMEVPQVLWEVFLCSCEYVLIIRLGAAGISRMKRRPITADGWRVLFREHSWTLLLTVAACLFPLSFLQRLRVGGYWNSYHFVYFLALAAAAVLMTLVRSVPKTEPEQRITRLAYGAIVLTLVVSMYRLKDMHENHTRLESATPRIAYRFLQEHGAVAYFPWNQVATYMAEGRIYHLDDGLNTMYLADRFPTKIHGLEFLPSNPDYIIFDSILHYGLFSYGYYDGFLDGEGGYRYENYYRILQFFPNFHRMTREEAAADSLLRDLPPDWILFQRRAYPRPQ